MRSFMILCFATFATAAPQYNYAPGGGHSVANDAFSGIGSSIIGSIGSHFGGGATTGHIGGATAGHSGSTGTTFDNISGGGGAGIGGGQFGGSNVFHQKQAIYHKNIYIHSAPEEDLNDAANRATDSLTENKHVNIVFIKTPDNRGLENAALQFAKSASEEKTAIYVLNKQTDISELKNKVDQIQEHVATKPQVHFIKYKTPEEAEFAQRTIQSSYDKLVGPTHVSNEGIAPVQNFIGALGGVYANGNSGQGSSYAPQQQYLPPSPSYLPA